MKQNLCAQFRNGHFLTKKATYLLKFLIDIQ